MPSRAEGGIGRLIGEPPARVQQVVEGGAEQREREDHEDDAGTGRDEVPPRPEVRRADLLGGIEKLAP